MPRSPEDAIAWARKQVTAPSQDWYRYCLRFVRLAFDVQTVIPDAGKSWDQSRHKRRADRGIEIPRGVPVYWELPSTADHVALSLGGGICLSTDARRRGKIDRVAIDEITRAWNGRLLGWTEDLNGVQVWQPTPTKPTRVEKARADVDRAVKRLIAAEKGGRTGAVRKFRKALQAALSNAPHR